MTLILCFLCTIRLAAAQTPATTHSTEANDSEYSLFVEAGQGSDLNRIVLDHQGRQMAVVSMDGGVRIWNVMLRQEVWNLSGQQGAVPIVSLAFSPDDNTIALARGTVIQFFSLSTGHSSYVTVPFWAPTCLVFNEDGSQLAAGGFYGRIDLISIKDGDVKTLYEPQLPSTQQIWQQRDNGQMPETVSALMFLGADGQLVSGSNRGLINTFELQAVGRDPKTPPKASVHVDGIVAAFAISNGQLLAAGANTSFSSARVWTVKDQNILLERTDCNTQVDLPNFAISELGNILATSCVDSFAKVLTYQLWELPSKRIIPFPEGLRGINIRNPTAISRDGTLLALSSENNKLFVLDLKSKLGPTPMEESPVSPVESIQSIAKTSELAISFRTQTTIWKNDGTTIVRSFPSSSGPIALSPDGTWMAYFDQAYKLHVVNRSNKRELPNPIKQANVEEYARHNAGFYNFRLAVSAEGPTVFWMEGGGFSGFAKFWKAGDTSEHILCDTANRGELVVSPSGRYVALGCNRGRIGFQSNQLLLFRVTDMQLVDEAYGDFQASKFRKESTVTGIAFAADEKSYLAAMNNEIQIRQIKGSLPPRHISSDLSSGNIYTGPIAVSESGAFIASQVGHMDMSSFTMSLGIEILAPDGHKLGSTTVSSLAKSVVFVSNKLAVGLQDGTTILYSVPNLKPMVTLIHPGGWVAVTPDGFFDGNAEALEWVGWRRKDQRAIIPLDLLYDNYFRPDLLDGLLHKKHIPGAGNLGDQLGLGSLGLMMQQGYAHVESTQDATYLCFLDPPQELDLYSDGAPLSFSSAQIERGVSTTCPWRARLPANTTKIESAGKRPTATNHCPSGASSNTQSTNRGTLHVLTVAVSNYAAANTYALPSAIPSALAIEKFFGSQPRGDGHLFRDIVIEPGLRDGGIPPTLANIRSSWTKIVDSTRQDDSVVLFLSGHGLVPPGTESFYFAPSDFNPSTLSTIRRSGLSVALLADMLRALPAQHVFLVIDACQSGAAVTSLAKIAQVKASTQMTNGRTPTVGVFILASATALQKATASPRGEVGLVADSFTRLASIDRNGRITKVSAGQIAAQVCDTLLSRTAQTPLIYSMGSNFDLIENNR